MAETKTKATAHSVEDFLASIGDDRRREDCETIAKIMKKATRADPKMWGTSIVGFGDHHYTYASGREGDTFVVGFAPRKNDITLYLVGGIAGHEALLKKLGKFKTGQSCLHLKKLDDVDAAVLQHLIDAAAKKTAQTSGLK